jgi:hypothetical protein
LRGSFWLGKDFFEKSLEFSSVLEPEAQKLAEIRNHLEHKYLKVDDGFKDMSSVYEDVHPGLKDPLAYSISRQEVETKTLKLLKLVRAALTYLSLAIHSEESARAKNRNPKHVFPMTVSIFEDEWKR